jgi:hypothetical protein
MGDESQGEGEICMGTECGNGQMFYIVDQLLVSHRFVLKEPL